MKLLNFKPAALSAALVAAAITPAYADIIVSEVDAAGSATTTYAADWFELTNTGAAAVSISGWKMDDNSNAFASAVALRGVTSIAAGQSVVFVEGNTTGSTDATIDANFETAWFGSNIPSGFVIGNYGGSGVGLSQTTDAVNIFNSTGTWITGVNFGASALGNTFDNAAGLSGVTISQFSVAGINGAFTSHNGVEVGSPGTVPVPAAVWLFTSALAGFLGISRRKS